MKSRRKNCVVCGRGFMCPPNRPVLFDKKKCAMVYYGKDWKPGLYKKPEVSHWSLEEKIEFAKKV